MLTYDEFLKRCKENGLDVHNFLGPVNKETGEVYGWVFKEGPGLRPDLKKTLRRAIKEKLKWERRVREKMLAKLHLK